MSAPLTGPYADRREAGRHLAQSLLMYRARPDAIVLAVSRSAVPIGDGIAESLELPLDIFTVHKVGVPGVETVGMGFIARSTYLPDQRVLANAGISLSAFTESAKRLQERLDALETFYRNGRPAPTITGRTVILADDAVTDESLLAAAVEALHRHGVGEVILAVPAATATARERLEKSTARFVCANDLDAETQLETWYLDASEPDDETVRATLDDARGRLAPAKHSDIILKQSVNKK
jgi:putative phosphoribosyl transferase